MHVQTASPAWSRPDWQGTELKAYPKWKTILVQWVLEDVIHCVPKPRVIRQGGAGTVAGSLPEVASLSLVRLAGIEPTTLGFGEQKNWCA
jgi:hypothetical protein